MVLAGAVLRVWGLVGWDMWTDEVQTLRMAERGAFWFGPMYSTAPVNFWLTGWSVDLLGADALGLRAVPALSGVLTVALLFPVARRWVSDRAALFATALLAFSFWHVAWSQTGRHFALQTLLVLGGLHGFLLYWKEGRKSGLALMAVSLLAALFTHSSSGFYVAALLLVVAVRVIGEVVKAPDVAAGLRALWPRAGLAALVLGVLLVVYLPIYLGVGSYLLENRSAWNPPWNIVGSLGFYLPPVLVAFATGGAFHLWGRDRPLAVTLVSLAVVPAALLTAASFLTIASAAYALPSLLALVILAGAACDALLNAASGRRAAVVCAGLVVAGLFLTEARDLGEYYLFENGLKPRWSEAADYVRAHRRTGERVWADEGDVARYYLGEEGVTWMNRYPGAGPEGRGDWFILYLEDRPDLAWMLRPAVRADALPPGARFKALFPLRYGPKDRTLMVLHRPAHEEEQR